MHPIPPYAADRPRIQCAFGNHGGVSEPPGGAVRGVRQHDVLGCGDPNSVARAALIPFGARHWPPHLLSTTPQKASKCWPLWPS